MQQPAFDWSAPHQGITRVSRACSRAGAISAEERIARQCLELLTRYRSDGPLTDAEAAKRLGVERTTVNARRHELIDRGLVMAYGTRKNDRSGVRNTTWGLTTAGERVADQSAG